MTGRLLAAALTAAALVWSAAIVLVPLTADHRASLVPRGLVHTAGALVCHQRAERSFYLDGNRLPVCARCAGLYLAGTMGLLLGWAGRPRTIGARRMRVLLAAAAVPLAATVALEWAGFGTPPNAVRAASAVPLGTLAGWLFAHMLRADGAERQMGYHSGV